MIVAARFTDLTKRQQAAILIGAPASVALVLAYLLYSALGRLGTDPDDHLPSFLHREPAAPQSLWAQINQARNDIASKQQIIDRGPKDQATLASLTDQNQIDLDRLPRSSEKAGMRLLIGKLARDIPSDMGNVQVLSVKITEENQSQNRDRSNDEADMQKIIYETELQADTNGMIKYIDVIEKNPRYMAVDSLSVKPGTVSLDADHKPVTSPHQIKMSLVTYVYNPTQATVQGGR
jgi:hypothetical protein